VELYKKDLDSYYYDYKLGDYTYEYTLLLKTVTFDDGHFEFKDLNPEKYQVKVVADGYDQTEEGYVTVEAGRQARIDLQVKKQETGLVVRTTDATVDGTSVILNGKFTYSYFYPSEVGFIYATNNSMEDGTLIKCDVSSSFRTTLTEMSPGQYYYMAYAKNNIGIAYGEVRSFTIKNPDYITFSNLMIQTRDLGRFRLHEAEELCASSRVGGYSDWRLPTVAELSMIYQFKDEIGGFKKNSYWSSTDIADRYYYVDFSSGSQYSSYSTEYRYVRAVRTAK